MISKDLRKEYRIPSNKLPKEYIRFTILLGQGNELEVETTDLSLGGFGFLAGLSLENFVPGSRLVLYPLGHDSPVYGVVVHAASTERGTRVGVLLNDLGGYRTYRAKIQEIFKDIDSHSQS